MAVPFISTAFVAGEVAPSLFGRVDIQKVHLGAATMRNLFVNYRGGAYSRAGSSFVGFSKQTGRSYPPRLITFQFNINQGLSLEFGHLYMRVISNGAFVTETPLDITGITNANPGVVTVANSWANGDWVFLSGIVGMTQLNVPYAYVVANATPTSITLQDIYGNPIDTTLLGAYVSGGTAARIYTLATPYAEEDLEYLKVAQSADVMSICCWNQISGNEYHPQDLTRLADNDWTLVDFTTAPVLSPPTSVAASSAGAAQSGGTNATFAYEVTAVDILGNESVASAIGTTWGADIESQAGTNTVTWAPVTGAQLYNVYRAPPSTDTPDVGPNPVPPGSYYGYVGSAFGTVFLDVGGAPDLSQTPPLHLSPFSRGQILSVDITDGGSGLTGVTFAITSATGFGFAGYPVLSGGSLGALVVTDGGGEYQPGDSIAFDGSGYASGAIDFGATNPMPADTITLNGIVWTFVATITGARQTKIAGTLGGTLSSLATNLSASTNGALDVASYTVDDTQENLLINYNTAGPAGNAYTLAASRATPSGATLTGGSGIGGTAPTGTLVIGPESGTYPGAVAYFQERRIYAATTNNPDTYFMSQPGLFYNFDARIPTISDDSITGSPWSVEVNGIQAMVNMPGGLVVLTGLSAWQLTGVGGSSLNPQPITPSNQQAQPQAYNGCSATVPPIRIDNDILYVQAKGSIVRDLSYNFFANIYTGADLTQLSSHLFTGYTIKEWAWCEEPYKVVWAVRNDGILLSLTYLKSEEISGWARHDTNGIYCSVCSVTEPPVDALYAAVQRFPGGNSTYMIERMNNRIWNDIEDAWCVDCGLALAPNMPGATLSAASATGPGELTGVTHLIGGAGYSSETSATVIDDNGEGPGGGAVVALTIVGGAITRVTFTAPGANYIRPALVFNDPTGVGSGASASPVVNNDVVFTASQPVLYPAMYGHVIRLGGGIATVKSVPDATTLVANITSPITQVIPNSGGIPQPQPHGSWTMTAPIDTVSGLGYLAGMTVTGIADGQVIPPMVVPADGVIELPVRATSIVLGLGFTAQLQTMYLDAGQPTVQGQRKRISQVTARIEASLGLTAGTNQVDGSTLSPSEIEVEWTEMDAIQDTGPQTVPPPYGSNVIPLQTGDRRIPVKGSFKKPGQVAIQQTNPLPMNILAIISEVFPGDVPQTGEPKSQGSPQKRAT